MSDFLRRLAERAAGAPTEVRPALPPRFAPSAAALPASGPVPAARDEAESDVAWPEEAGTDVAPPRPVVRAAAASPPHPAPHGTAAAATPVEREGPLPAWPLPQPRRPADGGNALDQEPPAAAAGEIRPVPAPRPPLATTPAGEAARAVDPAPADLAGSGAEPPAGSPHPASVEPARVVPLAPTPAPRAATPVVTPLAPHPVPAPVAAPLPATPPTTRAALAVPTRRAGQATPAGPAADRGGIVPAPAATPAGRGAGETGAPAAASVLVAGRGAEPAAPPTIEITIGRVEVRAVAPAPAPRPARAAAPSPAVSLDDYLRARGGGR